MQRGSQKLLHRAGVADLDGKTPIQAADSMRLASVAKAFSGAVALSAAADGALSLSDTVGKVAAEPAPRLVHGDAARTH